MRQGKGREGKREADLQLELGELAALRLEGEDGPVHVRDLGLLHEDVPHPGTLPLPPAARRPGVARRLWRAGEGKVRLDGTTRTRHRS